VVRVKLKIFVIAALAITGFAVAATAQDPSPGPGDEVPDPGETDFESLFAELESYPCPVQQGFQAEVLEGTTSWQNGTHPRASQGCVAQWGDGSYDRGTRSTLEAPDQPTRHLAASNAPSQTVNTAAEAMLEAGIDPQIVAPAVGSLADGCRAVTGEGTVTGFELLGSRGTAADLCTKTLAEGAAALEVPEVPAGAGALYLDVSHAYDFSEPDENQVGPDGGWVEVRTPGESYQRLDPVALFAPTEEGLGTACSITGPLTVTTADRTRRGESLPGGVNVRSLQGYYERYAGETVRGVAGDRFPTPFDVLPANEEEWRQDCAGTVRQVYGLEESQDVEGTGEEARLPPSEATRLNPYPGTIQGEGRGFVGSTGEDRGQPRLVDSWFDLTPYAGETVELRFHAVGGAGLGTVEGGWWIDEANVRYTGPPYDLGVRVATPDDGDSLPADASQITPGGTMPVDVAVENLGRTTTQSAAVEISLGDQAITEPVPELEPFQTHRVSVNLPVPAGGQADVQAQIVQSASAEGTTETGPHADAFPANDEDAVTVSFDSVRDLDLSVTDVTFEESAANVTLQLENQGNAPETVTVVAERAPVDLVTRTARTDQAVPLGAVDTVTVPHGDDENAFGVSDPTRALNTTVDLPGDGVWQVAFEVPGLEARDTAVVPVQEATPTAVSDALGRTVEGPTSDVPRGGFELPHITDEEGDPISFQVQPRNPVGGPDTRFVPTGGLALATDGRELPDEWAPVAQENPASGVYAGEARGDECGFEVSFDDDGNRSRFGEPLDTSTDTAVGFVNDVACAATDDPVPLGEQGVRADTTKNAGPPPVQAWNVREHHVAIYGVGTQSSAGGDLPNENAIRDLSLERDDEQAYLTFDHAADVEWTNGRGAKAHVTVVPGGQVNLVEEMRALENQTREITSQLPPKAEALANTVLMDVFFETVRQNTPETRLPQDACIDSAPAGVSRNLNRLCGNAQVLEAVESNCEEGPVDSCQMPEQAASTYLNLSAELRQEDGIVETWDEPTGWTSERIDITSVVENTTTEDGPDEGFYVMFDLTTRSDLEDVLASARADAPGRGENATATTSGAEEGSESQSSTYTGSQSASARAGWSTGELPRWTVDEPVLERVREGVDEPIVEWCLGESADEQQASGATPTCPTERVLTPADTRGWTPYDADVGLTPPGEDNAGLEMPWRFEQRGGDASSASPGALVWEGGTGELVQTRDGIRTAIDMEEPGTNTVLETPEVDLSGYDKPVVSMNVQWGKVNTGEMKIGPEEKKIDDLPQRCEQQSEADEATVWTRTGWNVRVRPVEPDGSLGEAETVEPVRGYHECNPDGDVPVLFDGRAVERTPYSYRGSADVTEGSNRIDDTYRAPSERFALGSDCQPSPGEIVDPGKLCKRTELAFGHEQPVFALPMPGWNEVAFDLSEYRGQEVQVEVHAFGINDDSGTPRGELRVDSFEVSEGAPPFDVRLSHEKRSFIAPDSPERFEPTLENRGSEPVEEVQLRRTVIGPDGCQATEPVTTPWLLLDPETGQPGLPPGVSTTIPAGQLSWDVPDETNEIYQRRLTVETSSSLAPSEAPETVLAPNNETGDVSAFVLDPDDCGEDVDVTSEVLHGDADVEADENTVTVGHASDDVETRSSVKVQATDAHGVEGLPAYVTPLPPAEVGAPAPAFEVDCQELTCTFDASGTEDPENRVDAYDWFFDDPGVDKKNLTGETVTFEFSEEGTYRVDLTVVYDEDEETSISRFVSPDDPNTFEQAGRQLNEIRDAVLEPDEDQPEPEEVLSEAGAQATVQRSAIDEQGTGSAVEIEIDRPKDSLRTTVVVPCETGPDCEDGLVEEFGEDELRLEGLTPGHYLGYVMFGDRFAFTTVEFTVELEPEAGSDARPADNIETLRSEVREEPDVDVEDIELSKLVPAGEDVRVPVEITNNGNVPLQDVTTSVRVEPAGLSLQADRIQRLQPGETRTTAVQADLTDAGPATVLVDAEAQTARGEAVTDTGGSGVVVVERQELDAEPGDYENWETGDALQFGDGQRVTPNVNASLPLTGTVDTASSPLSLVELNVSGELEQGYDGLALELLQAEDAERLDGADPYKAGVDVLRPSEYTVPGEDLRPFLGEDQDRLPEDAPKCDPLDRSLVENLDDRVVGVDELPDESSFACQDVPLDNEITSSHPGGEPGELTPALTGSTTLNVPGRDAQTYRPSLDTDRKLVDTVGGDDWFAQGGFTLEAESNFLDGGNGFWMPTGSLTKATATQYEHELRVPLTVEEWCTLSGEMVPERTPFRIQTQERRLFSEEWDVNVRFEAYGFSQDVKSPTVKAEPVVALEDETTTDWSNLEYDVPLGPLFPVVAADGFPASLDTSSSTAAERDSCSELEKVPDQKDRLANAEIVFELTSESGPSEDAFEVGWFLGTIEVPQLGIEVGANTGNHVPQTCGDGNRASWAPNAATDTRSVLGCTRLGTGSDAPVGSLKPGDNLEGVDEEVDSPLYHVQSVNLGGSSASLAYDEEEPTLLSDLLSQRPFQVQDASDTSLPRDATEKEEAEYPDVLVSPETDGRLRYVDAVALADLRAGLEGEVRFDLDVSSLGDGDGEILAQVVGAPVEPSEAFGESAPSRVDWTPLDVCDSITVGSGFPKTPLGAEENPLGRLDSAHTTLDANDEELCADLAPVSGEVTLIGVRLWVPSGDRVEIGQGEISMDVPEPQQLAPQLRALTDGTVHEGSVTVHDVSVLRMPPAFSHDVDARFDDPQEWRPDDGAPVDVLPSNRTPELVVDVTQPARTSTWTIDVNVTVETTDSRTWGHLDLDQDTYEGSQELRIPWTDLRSTVDWLADRPVLPQNVTELDIEVETTPERLVDGVSGCPTDLQELADSKDRECRQLADVVDENTDDRVRAETETALNDRGERPGVRDVSVTPDRAPAPTARTVEIELANPSSLPVSLEPTLELSPPEAGDFYDQDVGEVNLDPWQRTTVTAEVPASVDDRHDEKRVVVTVEAGATTGDQAAEADYRATDEHPSQLLQPFFFDESDSSVALSEDAAKPPFDGAASDGVGWRIESRGGARSVTPLVTNAIEADELEAIMDRGGDPLLTFQHQRQLRGEADSTDQDFTFLAAVACPGAEDPGTDPGERCVVLEDGWGPTPSTEYNPRIETTSQGDEYEACTEDDNGASEDMQAHGLYRSGARSTVPVLDGSTGLLKSDELGAWQTAAVRLDDDAVQRAADRDDSGGEPVVHFRILLGECSTEAESTVLVDDVELTSSRPTLDVGAGEIPIWPGAEKSYRFTLDNRGAGSDTVNVAPSAEVPDDWTVSVDVRGERVYEDGDVLGDVELAPDETVTGIARVKAPAGAAAKAQPIPLTAYATDAPGVASSGAVNLSAAQDDTANRRAVDDDPTLTEDPGNLELTPQRQQLPNLNVVEESITVEDPQIGAETNIQFEVENDGFERAEDVSIVAAVRGPSGFQVLESASGESPVRTDVSPRRPATLTFSWTPIATGEHTLRVIADPEPGDVGQLIEEDVDRFFGLTQEAQECEPGTACPNVVDHEFEVLELQQPDLRLSVDGVPDRISVGDRTELEVVVENLGGRAATDAELTLTENGLLPIFDTATVDLPTIEPGNQTVLRTTWAPVSPGEGLVLGSVSGPDVFTGQRADGSIAGEDSDVAIPVTIDRAQVNVRLDEPIRTEPGVAHAVRATITNQGTRTTQLLPDATESGGALLSSVAASPVDVPPGEQRNVTLLGFAEIGTQPGTERLEVPLTTGSAEVDVHIRTAPDARISVDERPLDPGETSLDAVVSNEGNVPLDGQLEVRGPGLHGTVDLDVPVDGTANVTVPLTVRPDADPGRTPVAVAVTTSDDARVTEHERITVNEAPAVAMDLTAREAPLAGSAEGELVVRNVGNQPLEGRLTLDGPVSTSTSPALDLDPGQARPVPVTWISGTQRNGTAAVETLDGEVVGTTPLVPAEVEPGVELRDLETRPSVNLEEGMEVQVVGTVENTGDAPLRNQTLGITVDGELYQTFELPELEPGETTRESAPIELPRSGELTIGLVDLAAFQRGEPAGAATTVEAEASTFGLGTVQSIPSVPWAGVVGVLGLAAGVSRR
jgi:uncharacterized membrane protein